MNKFESNSNHSSNPYRNRLFFLLLSHFGTRHASATREQQMEIIRDALEIPDGAPDRNLSSLNEHELVRVLMKMQVPLPSREMREEQPA